MIAIHMLSTVVFMASFCSLCFAIFKIPIRENHKQIAVISLALATVNYCFKFIIESPYFMVVQTLTFMILLTVIRLYPLLYSFVIVTVGSLVASLLETVFPFVAIKLKLTTYEKMISDVTTFVVLHFFFSAIYILIAYVMSKYKFGFSFIKGKFTYISITNVVWSILLIASTTLILFITKEIALFSTSWYIVILLIFGLTISLLYAHNRNKKDLKDRYGAFENAMKKYKEFMNRDERH